MDSPKIGNGLPVIGQGTDDIGVSSLHMVGYLGKNYDSVNGVSGEYCPACKEKGKQNALRTFRISFEESILLCEDLQCIYPLVSKSLNNLLSPDLGNCHIPDKPRQKRKKSATSCKESPLLTNSKKPKTDAVVDGEQTLSNKHNGETHDEASFHLPALPPHGQQSPLGTAGSLAQTETLEADGVGLADKHDPSAMDVTGTREPSPQHEGFLPKLEIPPENNSKSMGQAFCVQWKNAYSLCWLDCILSALVHLKALKMAVTELGSGEDSIFRRLLTKYERANELLCTHQPGGLQDGDGKKLPLEVSVRIDACLNEVRDEIFTRLQPQLRCTLGDMESPVFAFPLLLKIEPQIEKLFMYSFSWNFECSHCGYKYQNRCMKTLVTFTHVVPEWHPLNAARFGPCNSCSSKSQIWTMALEKIPPLFMLHFVEGLPHNDLGWYAFHFEDSPYQVTSVIQYQANNHFITWILEADGQWLKCDDLKGPCSERREKFEVPASEIHIVIWERKPSQVPDKAAADFPLGKMTDQQASGNQDPVFPALCPEGHPTSGAATSVTPASVGMSSVTQASAGMSLVTQASAKMSLVTDTSAEMSLVNQASVEMSSVTQASAEMSSVIQDSAETPLVTETSAEKSSITQASAEMSSVVQDSAETPLVTETSAEMSSITQASAEMSSVIQDSAETPLVTETSAEKSSITQASAEMSSVIQDSAETSLVTETSAEMSLVSQASAETSLDSETSTETSLVSQASSTGDPPALLPDEAVDVGDHLLPGPQSVTDDSIFILTLEEIQVPSGGFLSENQPVGGGQATVSMSPWQSQESLLESLVSAPCTDSPVGVSVPCQPVDATTLPAPLTGTEPTINGYAAHLTQEGKSTENELPLPGAGTSKPESHVTSLLSSLKKKDTTTESPAATACLRQSQPPKESPKKPFMGSWVKSLLSRGASFMPSCVSARARSIITDLQPSVKGASNFGGFKAKGTNQRNSQVSKRVRKCTSKPPAPPPPAPPLPPAPSSSISDSLASPLQAHSRDTASEGPSPAGHIHQSVPGRELDSPAGYRDSANDQIHQLRLRLLKKLKAKKKKLAALMSAPQNGKDPNENLEAMSHSGSPNNCDSIEQLLDELQYQIDIADNKAGCTTVPGASPYGGQTQEEILAELLSPTTLVSPGLTEQGEADFRYLEMGDDHVPTPAPSHLSITPQNTHPKPDHNYCSPTKKSRGDIQADLVIDNSCVRTLNLESPIKTDIFDDFFSTSTLNSLANDPLDIPHFDDYLF
ncbi:PREDICTED: SUMO-specific isopeptidase USPL1 [Elephantulus edwardii]|uniref:SUMO-specific isopeptidase USPL1 n=1 Tax=Elephantulus edwardii TaxID=28737 RepID=UPI0003F06CE4|nr:PREDICTED: SUMO-specific isopeptidase USPL1 [Elephantulus edwardii]